MSQEFLTKRPCLPQAVRLGTVVLAADPHKVVWQIPGWHQPSYSQLMSKGCPITETKRIDWIPRAQEEYPDPVGSSKLSIFETLSELGTSDGSE